MWQYQGDTITSIEQMPENSIGFIYIITNTEEEKIYVGKKHMYKGKNWLNYYGSSKELIEDIKLKGKETFRREIIKFCNTNIALTYYEVYYQMGYKVLTTNSYNKNILGKFYKGRITE